MFKTYLKIAWRNLTKNKTFTALNLIGLSVAFCAAILLTMSALLELSYDRFHTNTDVIQQLFTVRQMPNSAKAVANFPEPLAKSLKDEVPGVKHITRVLEDNVLITVGKQDYNLDINWVDNDFFSIFNFPSVDGSATKFPDQSSVIITKKAAKTIFGEPNVLGKTLIANIKGQPQPFTICAVLEDVPKNSSLDFEVIFPFERAPGHQEAIGEWTSWYHQVFLTLEEHVDPKTFEKNTDIFYQAHFSEEIKNAIRDGAMANAYGNYMQALLFPFKNSNYREYVNGIPVVNKTSIYIILGVALLLIVIACVNFTNMSIAKSTQRLKEIGMQKALGAPKRQLFLQLWSESIILFITTVGIGLILSYFLLNPFKSLFNTEVSYTDFGSPIFLLGFILVILAITFIAGGYPALVMSKFGIIPSLKGKFKTNGNNHLRNGLVVFQFAITIILISGTLVLWKQLNHMQTMNLGFDKDYIISLPLNGKRGSYEAVNLLRNELINQTNILSVSGSDNNIGVGRDGSSYSSQIGFDYQNRTVRTNMLIVEPDYVETMGLKLVAGRDFDRNRPADSLSIVINEAMAKTLEEEDPLSVKIFMEDSLQFSVMGVLKDYHFERLNRKIEPLSLFMIAQADLLYAYVKIAPTNISESYNIVEKAWKRVEPNAVFMGSFLDENIDRTFRKEKNLNTLITSGAIIAIILSCIGLFALSLLVVNQRTKEIGIRKVVGANIASLTFLLTKDFLKLVLIGFVIALPLAWWMASKWLEAYAFKTDLTLITFLLPGLIALIISFFTISAKTISAATQNPTKSLRTE